ncbi:MAG: DUF3467 domain-containing protein [Saprospiraceae bacterium]|jgi:hypothetical protein|nr:DUF3467 domain-containing protein [Saprospiraceae bacterium]
MSQENTQQNQITIDLPEDIGEGTYANLAIIAHSQAEFVIDFVRTMPNVPKAKVKSRIIITPSHAKRLLHALTDNIKKYESQYGTIDMGQGGGGTMQFPPLNFTPTAKA